MANKELGKYEEALDCFDKTIMLNPFDSKAYYNKGKLLFKMGLIKEAEEVFNQEKTMLGSLTVLDD